MVCETHYLSISTFYLSIGTFYLQPYSQSWFLYKSYKNCLVHHFVVPYRAGVYLNTCTQMHMLNPKAKITICHGRDIFYNTFLKQCVKQSNVHLQLTARMVLVLSSHSFVILLQTYYNMHIQIKREIVTGAVQIQNCIIHSYIVYYTYM